MTFKHKNTIKAATETYKQVSKIRDIETKDIKEFEKIISLLTGLY